MPATEIWTFQDMTEHLLDVFDSERAGRPLRVARRAVLEALRELSAVHRWTCYDSTRTFKTSASYSTGTIEYDHTGGAYERLVTLTGGTWPSTARYSKIIISDVHYPVESVIDTTRLVLSGDENPGADVAAGTGYMLYRPAYPLPIGFVEIGELWCIDDKLPIPIIPADQEHRNSIFLYDSPDDPRQVCIRNDGEFLNSLSLVFSPPPSSSKTYSFNFHRSPRQLITEKYSTGTVTVTGGSTTCTITTGSFAASHIGCIIRFGTAANEPDNIFGGIGDTENPFVAQRTIVAVSTDGTTCTLDSILPAAVTDVKFTVSDPIDIEHTSMLTALQRMAEAAYSRLTKREQKERRDRDELALMALRLAKEKDQRALNMTGITYYDPFTHVTITDDET